MLIIHTFYMFFCHASHAEVISKSQMLYQAPRTLGGRICYHLVILQFAIENCKMAIEIVDLPIKHGGSFHSYVSLTEGLSH